MTSPLDLTIAEITQYDDPTPRIVEVMNHGEARVFLGDARVERGDLLSLPSTRETLRVLTLQGQREAIASTLHGALDARTRAEVFITGARAAFSAPSSATLYTMHTAQYVSASDMPDALPAQLTRPTFNQLDGARTPLITGIPALDLLSPLSRGGVNLVLDASAQGEQGDEFAHVRERVERALDASTSRMTVRQSSHPAKGLSEVITASESRGTFYTALRVAASWVASRRAVGEEVFFFAELPQMSSHEAWQQYYESVGQRSGREMSYADIVGWMGEHFTSTTSAHVTTLITLKLQAVEGDVNAIIDTMNLGDVDALIVIDERGHYAPQRSRSRTPQPAHEALEATRLRGVLHRAAALTQKLELFGEDELTPAELATIEEAERWAPRISRASHHSA